ncbi:MAG: hypothetical protein QNM02_14985 [Acidimicrobiia bacterium]|nr:hypothetical protein [Acidimicrobiia bacterium]
MTRSGEQPVRLEPRVERIAELTRTQSDIWTSQRLHPSTPLANMGKRTRIAGVVDAWSSALIFEATSAAYLDGGSDVDLLEVVDGRYYADPASPGDRVRRSTHCTGPNLSKRRTAGPHDTEDTRLRTRSAGSGCEART